MIDIKENVDLAPMTTLGVGGPAEYFVEAAGPEQVVEAFEYARARGLDVFVLGGGSNIVVSDKGFAGLVLRPCIRGINISEYSKVTVGAGEDWDSFVAKMVTENLAGLECLSGIPGSVGGTPVQNVGAYGQEVSETILSVHCYDRDAGTLATMSNSECGFSYRRSVFNTDAKDRFVVLSVVFALNKNGKPKVFYKDLIEYFDGHDPSLSDVRKAVIDIRRSKSMVIDKDDPNSRSAGSFFKNPIISKEKFGRITASFANVPNYPSNSGTVKVPAAWLIEQSGFHKGFKLGDAGISSNHTLAIINRGNASAAEIIALMKTIQAGVKERFGIELQPEPIFVGFDAKLS